MSRGYRRRHRAIPRIPLHIYVSICKLICNILQRNLNLCIPRKGIARPHSPNFHIHVSVSDLHIPTLGNPNFLQQSDERNTLAHRNMNVGIGRPSSFPGNMYLFRIFGFVSLQCTVYTGASRRARVSDLNSYF
jgi:hypothetical protein